MVKYTMMKRITQMLASILFVISVLTIYLLFDFAITNAVSNKHEHKHEDIKLKKSSSLLELSKLNKINQTLIFNYMNNPERRTRSVKPIKKSGKPAQFHKSKTGIKINQIRKPSKTHRKSSSTTKNIELKMNHNHI